MANSLFFLKNLQHNTKSLEVYLERRDFIVQTESTVSIALEKILESKPAFVFAAWDHHDKAVESIISQIPAETVVIPYITSTSGPDTRKLMNLDVPLKMFPPLSGPAIQRLVHRFEKEKHNLNSSQNKKLTSSKANLSDDSTGTFVNKGERFKTMNTLITSRARGEIQNISSFDSETDLTLAKPTARFSKSMQVKISEIQKQSLEAKFDGKIQEELKEIIETAKELTTADHQQTIFCMLIQAIDCSGLVLLNTAWNLHLEDAQSALSTWGNVLTSQYHKNEVNKDAFQSDIFAIHMPTDLNVFDICSSKSSIQKEIIVDGKKTVMAFFDMQHNPFNLNSSENENYLSIDSDCLHENSSIPFDVYFELKENKKMLKMFKKETLLSDKDMASISEKKINPLLISANDELLWYKYGVEVYLKKL